MDVLKNFSWIELLFILGLGLFLFGPDRLPAIGVKLAGSQRYVPKSFTSNIWM